jgi:preprotein translocase subunit YajC
MISNAWAQGAGGGGRMDRPGILPIVLMFVVLYFLMIRPQMKRAKEHQGDGRGAAEGRRGGHRRRRRSASITKVGDATT